jgi:hypothetical protein
MPHHLKIKPCESCGFTEHIELVRDEITRPGTVYVRPWCRTCNRYPWLEPRTIPKGILAQPPGELAPDPTTLPHPDQIPMFQK